VDAQALFIVTCVAALFIIFALITAVIVLAYKLAKVKLDSFDGKIEEIRQIISESGLSRREEEVMNLLLKNKSYGEIANKLYISKDTVKQHARKIYLKTGAKNKTDLVIRFK